MPEPISHRDQRFESLFTRWNLTFDYLPDLHLTDEMKVLDDAQVRDFADIAPPEKVQEYVLQMKNGANFPPLVVAAQLRDSTNVLIDGNTRGRAARQLHRDTLPAYRVSPIPDEKFAKVLAAALNQLGGNRLSQQSAHKAAMYAMDMGLTDDQIACEIGYSAESVRRWRRDQLFAERVNRLGMADMASKLTKTQQRGISKIDHDGPFADIVTLVAETKPDQQDFRELVESVQKANSDSEAVELIEKAREDWRPIGPPPQKVYRNKTAGQARMHLGGLLKIDPASVFDPGKADEDFAKWQQLRDVVEQVLAVFRSQQQGNAA